MNRFISYSKVNKTRTQGFTYDDLGNQLTYDQNANQTTYVYGGANELAVLTEQVSITTRMAI